MLIVHSNNRRRPVAIDILWCILVLATAGIALPRGLDLVTDIALRYLGW